MKTKYIYLIGVVGFISVVFCLIYFKQADDDNDNAFMLSENCSTKYFSNDLKIPESFEFVKESNIECAYNTPIEKYKGFITFGLVGTHTNFDEPASKYKLDKSYKYNDWKIKLYSLKEDLGIDYMLFVIEKDQGYVMFNKKYLLNWFVNQ